MKEAEGGEMDNYIENAENTKKKLFFVAVKLFSEKGYKETSIKDIVTYLNMSKGAVYNHYKSKEEILDKIFSYLENKLLKRSTPVETVKKLAKDFSPEELIKNGKKEYISLFENELESRIWMIVESLQNVDERAAKLIIRETNRITENIKTMLSFQKEFGKIKENIDTESLSYIISYSMRGLIMEYAIMKNLKKDRAKTEKKMDRVLNQIAEFL